MCAGTKLPYMPRDATEVIRVTPENWQRLNSMKRPGESFNDVVGRLLDETDDEGNEHWTAPEATD